MTHMKQHFGHVHTNRHLASSTHEKLFRFTNNGSFLDLQSVHTVCGFLGGATVHAALRWDNKTQQSNIMDVKLDRIPINQGWNFNPSCKDTEMSAWVQVRSIHGVVAKIPDFALPKMASHQRHCSLPCLLLLQWLGTMTMEVEVQRHLSVLSLFSSQAQLI